MKTERKIFITPQCTITKFILCLDNSLKATNKFKAKLISTLHKVYRKTRTYFYTNSLRQKSCPNLFLMLVYYLHVLLSIIVKHSTFTLTFKMRSKIIEGIYVVSNQSKIHYKNEVQAMPCRRTFWLIPGDAGSWASVPLDALGNGRHADVGGELVLQGAVAGVRLRGGGTPAATDAIWKVPYPCKRLRFLENSPKSQFGSKSMWYF